MKLIYMNCTLNYMVNNGYTEEQINDLMKTGIIRSTITEIDYLVIEE